MKGEAPFIPMTRKEMAARGWDELDVLFVSGDAYVDHPSFGVALLARLLESKGYRVGIVAQPERNDPAALQVMGRPRLFAAVSAGAMDSMVNHYTAAKKIRRDDAYTPGGKAGARPNRAVIAYTASVKGAFKGLPVLIGGIEASLRRLAHYDYWDDAVRRSVLVDSKADLLLYGMAETALLEVTQRASSGEALREMTDIRGTAWMAGQMPEGCVALASFEEVSGDKKTFGEAFRLAEHENNPYAAKPLAQMHGTRTVVVNPPALPLGEAELDRLYGLPFQKLPHPSYHEPIPAYEQIRFSITSHRGCFGGCGFCAITHHQGKLIQSRSEGSILDEIDRLTRHPDFRGTITDVGGPTANMYGLSCGSEAAKMVCQRSGCLYPKPCKHLIVKDSRAVRLLRKIRQHSQVKHMFVASGVRYDLLEMQPDYFDSLLTHHVGGLLKVAPESISEEVTRVMRKPGPQVFIDFLEQFRQRCRELGLRQAVVPYLISGHPGCTLSDMVDVALFMQRHQLRVEQVQQFTPTPGTLATCMYHTGCDPHSGESVYVARTERENKLQKALLLWQLPENRKLVAEALKTCRREKDGRSLLGGEQQRGVARRPRG